MIWICRMYPNGVTGLAEEGTSHFMVILANAYEIVNHRNKNEKVIINGTLSTASHDHEFKLGDFLQEGQVIRCFKGRKFWMKKTSCNVEISFDKSTLLNNK